MRYSASIAAVKASFFLMSATRKAFRKVLSMVSSLRDHLAGTAGGLDLLAGGLGERVRVDGQCLRDLALAESLHGDAAAAREPMLAQRVRRHLGVGVEALLEVAHVHRLGVRAELLERHRLLHVRAAELSHPHVDRRLPTLEAGEFFRARPRARALRAASRGLAGAGALAAADALARAPRAGGRLQVVEADRLGARVPRRGLLGPAGR